MVKKTYYAIWIKKLKCIQQHAIKWETFKDDKLISHFVPVMFDNREEAEKYLLDDSQEIIEVNIKVKNKLRYLN